VDLPPAPAEPLHGGTLRIALQAEGKSLDPHVVTDAASMRLIENLYATLLQYTPDYGDTAPWLAESYEISPNGRRYTFHLVQNAVFHSGRPVTSEDAAYSLKRIQEKGIRGDAFAAVTNIRTPDPHTLVLELSEPSAPLLTALANPMNAIVDRDVVEANEGRLDRVDAGCGPFELVEWKQDRHLILKRFDRYFEPDLPYLDRIEFRPIPDETARSTALRNGEVDLLLDVAIKDLFILEKLPGIHVQQVPGTFWEYMGLNTRKPPLDDIRVRRAIALALDRPQLLSLIKFDRGRILPSGPIPSTHWAAWDGSPYAEPNPEAARALLTEAGFPDGFDLTLTVGSAFAYQVDAAQVVKQQLRAVGIELELEALESGIFFDKLNQGDFEATLVGWLGFVDPDEWLFNIFHSEGKWNQQGYANAELDTLLEKGQRITDRDARAKIYRNAQKIIAEEVPMAFLYLNDFISAQRPQVQGFTPHPTGTTRGLRRTWIWNPEVTD
jgi:peptide/nickel transport system substrate-binding protein